jgi:putative transposase
MEKYTSPRNSFIEIGNIYFWTATINNWHQLMLDDACKQIVIDSLHFLSHKGKISVYAFVIMPNHLHLIWQTHALNGKESAQGSLLKFTAHEFKKCLLQQNAPGLQLYKVKASNKEYEFWQRDPLAIHLRNREMALQKLHYLHNNPLADRWQLSNSSEDYHYSSARFYETGVDNFGFLKHVMGVF